MDKKTWIRVIAVEAAIMVVLMLLAAFPRVNNKYNAEELIRLSEESFKTPAMKLGYGSYKYTIEYETNSENCFAFLDRQSTSEEGKQLIGRMESSFFPTGRAYQQRHSFSWVQRIIPCILSAFPTPSLP